MTELLALSAVLLAVALPLYYITLTATKKPAPGQATREELVAEIEKLNEALLNVSVKLEEEREFRDDLNHVVAELLKSERQYNKVLEVAQTTLGFVQLHTDRGLNWDAPFGEKLPEWLDAYDNGEIEGWEQVRKDLEAVLPKVGG